MQTTGGAAATRPFLLADRYDRAVTKASGAVDAPLSTWNPVQGAALTSAVVRSRHRLRDLPAFSEPELVRLLDEHPRELVQAYSPGALGEGTLPGVDLGTASGAAILDALRQGGLWMVIRVDSVDPAFAAIQAALLEEVGRVVPDVLPGSGSSNLLVSSPGTGVPFHLDTPPGILWHVRGKKRVWVYPALNDALVPREVLEDLYASVHREFVNYDRTFDDAALVFELAPGDTISGRRDLGRSRSQHVDGFDVLTHERDHGPRCEHRAGGVAVRALEVVARGGQCSLATASEQRGRGELVACSFESLEAVRRPRPGLHDHEHGRAQP